MKCPWCREDLPLLGRGPDCPHCGRSLREEGTGETIRPLDLDFPRISLDADERSATWVRRGAIYAAVCAAVGFLPFLAPIAYVFLVAGQFFFARFLVMRPYATHFGAARRLVTRWIGRLALVLLVLPVHAAVFVPGLALVTSPLAFWGTLHAFRAYGRFHLARERERIGILGVEKLVLAALAFCVLLGACIVGVLVYVGVLVLGGPGK